MVVILLSILRESRKYMYHQKLLNDHITRYIFLYNESLLTILCHRIINLNENILYEKSEIVQSEFHFDCRFSIPLIRLLKQEVFFFGGGGYTRNGTLEHYSVLDYADTLVFLPVFRLVSRIFLTAFGLRCISIPETPLTREALHPPENAVSGSGQILKKRLVPIRTNLKSSKSSGKELPNFGI